MRRKLTDKWIESAKGPAEGRIEILDTVQQGLALRITDKGVKSFAVRVRIKGEQVRRTLGQYPSVKLGEARDKARDVVIAAGRGVDLLAEEERQAAEAAEAETAAERLEWSKVAARFIEDYAKAHQRQWEETERIFSRYVTPRWSGRIITTIDKDDVLDLVHKIEKQSGVYQANRVLAAVRKLMNWAVLQPKMLKATPIVPGMALKGEQKRDRVLTEDEIKARWAAWEEQGYPFGRAMQLLLVTAQRRRAVGGMRWPDLDLDQKRWIIPGKLNKGGRPHSVPLSPLAVEILEALPRAKDEKGRPIQYVFTSGRIDGPISGWSRAKSITDRLLLEAAERAAKERGDDPAEIQPVANWRLHDLRRTAATELRGLGIDRETVSKILDHVERDATSHYDLYAADAEKRRALEAWANRLSLIVGRSDGSNVVRLAR